MKFKSLLNPVGKKGYKKSKTIETLNRKLRSTVKNQSF